MKNMNIKKIVIVVAVAVAALLLTNCGANNQQDPQMYGYQGQPCANMVNGFNGYNPFAVQGSYPTVGSFLNGNPQSIFKYGNGCYTGAQVNSMYQQYSQQYGMPWSQFSQSPYANFQMYYPGQQSNGTYNYSSSNNVNMNSNWVGAGDYFGGNPFMRQPHNQWALDFYYYNNR